LLHTTREYLFDDKRGTPGDIWAFGVTLLFVCRLVPLARGSWKISDVPLDKRVHMMMSNWFREVQRVSEEVPTTLSLLRSMLAMHPKKRITASQLANSLLAKLPHKPLDGELVV